MTQQLTLSIQLRDDATFENFYAGENGWVLRALQTWLAVEGEPLIYLWGAEGSGRSHLLQACCHTARAMQKTLVYLPLQELMTLTPAILDELEHQTFICIDDIDSVAQRPEWEEALFHFYNRMQAANTRLLVTARVAPMQSTFLLPDLRSRLSWGITAQVYPLNDEEKLHALQLHANARGIVLTEDVGHFLMRRCSRDMSTLLALFERLDQASLAAQRRLTIPFVKLVLDL